MRDVFIIGAGQTPVGEHWNLGLRELGAAAIRAALDMLARRPDDPAVLTLVGTVFADSGDRPEARNYFSKALQLSPGHVQATMSLARLEELEGNAAEATALYQGIIDSDPESVARMHWTRQWWQEDAERSEFVASVAVIEELQKGYMYKGKVLRHSKVKVSGGK